MTEATTAPEIETTPQLAVDTTRAAELIGISRRRLYDLIAAGDITATRLPTDGGQGEYRIEISELRGFLARNRQTT